MIGTTLGHYRVLDKLGEGGMGEVFVAHDTKLDRKVALKVLPASVAADSDRRERFAREARAIAALNHPSIVTVHSVELSGETHFLTMELVEGRTLADQIPAKGLPLDQLLKLAIPLADAVSAAHERGITHRDLKPANVMVTPDGRVKVLDFGLAKLKEDSPMPAPKGSVTALQAQPLTGEGRIVGTVSYMSPEQAEGKGVDHRSDIFSLGVMLYEMATGERPFKGDSHVSTLSSILRDTPKPVTDLNPNLPRDLGKIVRRMLTKDLEHRYQSAKDVRNELEELKREADSGELDRVAAGAVPARRRGAAAMALWAGAGAAVVALAWFGISRFAPGASTAPPLTATFTQITSAAGIETSPSLSPDGKWIVYASNGDIHLQSIGGHVPINLTKDEPAADSAPAFSPDGELIAFRSARGGGGIFVMGRTGESVRRLTDRGFDPAWTPDGKFLIVASVATGDPDIRVGVSEGWKVTVETGETTRISAGDFMDPAVSPNGHRVAYWALPVTTQTPLAFSGNDRDLWTIRLDGSDPVAVTRDAPTDWSPIWSPDGRFLYFASDRGGSMNLWRVAIDERSGRVSGEAEAITTPAPYLGFVTRSGDGQRLAYGSFVFSRNISRVSFDPARGSAVGESTAITTGSLDWYRPEPSPDGNSLVLASYHRQEDLYVARADGTGMRHLTNDQPRDRLPRWSPDGRQIAFYSNRSGTFSFWTINPDGSGMRERISTAMTLIYPVWSPDGTRIMASQNATRRNFIFALEDGVVSEPVETLPDSPESTAFSAWSWSPDGSKIAGYTATAIWVYSFDTKAYTRIVDGTTPTWLSDNRRLIYARAGALHLVDTVTKQSREILSFRDEALGDPRLTRDDRHLYFVHASTGADIWLLTFK
jgi:Tol biopolymer transport system component